jgi:hypothetical protein
MIKKMGERKKWRLKNDTNYHLKSVLRCRLYKCVRYLSEGKSKKTLDYLGCSIEEFKLHLESKFSHGMT